MTFDEGVTIDYTNYKGERRERLIHPRMIFFGTSEHHTGHQWLMLVWDPEKSAFRTCAMKDIHSWRPASKES